MKSVSLRTDHERKTMTKISPADKLIYDNYEKTLQAGLMKVCKSAGMLGDDLLSSPDIDVILDIFLPLGIDVGG